MEVLVVGSGGNGQTFFMQFLSKNNITTNNTSDTDGLKHISSPTLLQNHIIKKCIFIYNDPLKSILSHFRRNNIRKRWVPLSVQKLGNPYQLKNDCLQDFNKFVNLTIKNKCDIFGIKYQFDNWYNYKSQFPILFLNFNDILKKKKIINNFLGQKLNYNFFSSVPRNSHVDGLDPQFIKIYTSLYKYINQKISQRT